jgi:membrane-associated phospholipid phosphatase
LLLIYVIALPFYLFFPVTNVYTFYGAESALETVIPSVESFFYSATTLNNCLPSLHVAMTLLIAKSVSVTKNKRYAYFTYFCAVSVILSVIYLAIHWITDVICGVLLAFGVFYLQKKFISEK